MPGASAEGFHMRSIVSVIADLGGRRDGVQETAAGQGVWRGAARLGAVLLCAPGCSLADRSRAQEVGCRGCQGVLNPPGMAPMWLGCHPRSKFLAPSTL